MFRAVIFLICLVVAWFVTTDRSKEQPFFPFLHIITSMVFFHLERAAVADDFPSSLNRWKVYAFLIPNVGSVNSSAILV